MDIQVQVFYGQELPYKLNGAIINQTEINIYFLLVSLRVAWPCLTIVWCFIG